MRHKLAAPLALATAAVVFLGILVLTRSLLWPPLLATVAALGVYLMVDARSPLQAESDSYLDEANQRVEDALRSVRSVERLGRDVRALQARTALEAACRYVPELFVRVRQTAPNSLYSTASQVGGHLASLEQAVRQYLDVQRKPMLYKNANALLSSGEVAFARFADFALDSVRLINQGDVAQYAANLETVAPPKLPELG